MPSPPAPSPFGPRVDRVTPCATTLFSALPKYPVASGMSETENLLGLHEAQGTQSRLFHSTQRSVVPRRWSRDCTFPTAGVGSRGLTPSDTYPVAVPWGHREAPVSSWPVSPSSGKTRVSPTPLFPQGLAPHTC